MSLDEIRNQKALALLEFKEAEDNVARLEKQKASLVSQVHAFGVAIRELPDIPGEDFIRNHQHLTAESAAALLRELQAARKQLGDATAKKDQFGL